MTGPNGFRAPATLVRVDGIPSETRRVATYRLTPPGGSLEAAVALARELAGRPQAALRSDRLSSYEQWSMTLDEALLNEYRRGMEALQTGELVGGLERYESGDWS